jgi:hypothetical protein
MSNGGSKCAKADLPCTALCKSNLTTAVTSYKISNIVLNIIQWPLNVKLYSFEYTF